MELIVISKVRRIRKERSAFGFMFKDNPDVKLVLGNVVDNLRTGESFTVLKQDKNLILFVSGHDRMDIRTGDTFIVLENAKI
jgi:hypothetical protein